MLPSRQGLVTLELEPCDNGLDNAVLTAGMMGWLLHKLGLGQISVGSGCDHVREQWESLVLGKFGLVRSRAIFSGPETRQSGPRDEISGTGTGTTWDRLSRSGPGPDWVQTQTSYNMHNFVVQNPWANGEGGGTKQVSMGGCKGRAARTYHLGGLVVGGSWGTKRGGASVGVELASEKRVP